ncbi:unannotated protein [freshwater metagenome]|uniref:Unannotated protein n=1 Tax=freshwater metagenome TaxID=449393 RepID=A0A6J7PM77_9ZZZZ
MVDIAHRGERHFDRNVVRRAEGRAVEHHIVRRFAGAGTFDEVADLRTAGRVRPEPLRVPQRAPEDLAARQPGRLERTPVDVEQRAVDVDEAREVSHALQHDARLQRTGVIVGSRIGECREPFIDVLASLGLLPAGSAAFRHLSPFVVGASLEGVPRPTNRHVPR